MTRHTTDNPVLAMEAELARAVLADTETKPHEARIYDYLLGGAANWAVDRQFAKEQIRQYPELPWMCSQNRQCVVRFTQHLIDAGVRQFIDIGSGLPTQSSVHQVADQRAPGQARVVYVDHDPVAAAHSYLLLEDGHQLDRHSVVQGDLRYTPRIWSEILDHQLLDPAQPIAVILAAVLHFVPDEVEPDQVAPAGALTFLRERLVPGSHLAITHATYDGMSEQERAKLARVAGNYDHESTARTQVRSRAEITGLFGDWQLLEPGLVWVAQWRPDSPAGDMDPAKSRVLAGLARKPRPGM